jgi:hypothetical protein
MIWNALKNSAVAIFWVYIVFLGIYALFLPFFFRSKSILEVKIKRHKVSWHERETERDDEHLQTIPEAVLDNPNALHHKKCSILIRNYATSDRSADRFTLLLRRLAYFCSSPFVRYLHHLDSEGYRQTDHRIAFAKGESLCNFLAITKRSPTRVEASSKDEFVNIKTTRLVVMHLDVVTLKGAVLVLETLQW